MSKHENCLLESTLLVMEPDIIEAFNFVIASSCEIVIHMAVI